MEKYLKGFSLQLSEAYIYPLYKLLIVQSERQIVT